MYKSDRCDNLVRQHSVVDDMMATKRPHVAMVMGQIGREASSDVMFSISLP